MLIRYATHDHCGLFRLRQLVAAVDAPDVPWIARKTKSILSVMSGAEIEKALRVPFHITDDRQRIDWPQASHGVGIGDLLDVQKAQIFFVSWHPNAARNEIGREELVGCWQTVAGYTLLEADGHARGRKRGRVEYSASHLH